jgi:hypothetical protein
MDFHIRNPEGKIIALFIDEEFARELWGPSMLWLKGYTFWHKSQQCF